MLVFERQAARPIVECRYANPVLNLASQKTLVRSDRVQNVALWIMAGGIRGTPVTALEAVTLVEPFDMRRGMQTLKMEESNALKSLVETFGAVPRAC
ncbi:hypothetical protein ElyMa_006541800 [Elysia marginata]|uniref:Uncharacterized protein n=1 Tax=Elysia marginata TaxID=1093978 RepID=A0AAV4IA26_9GAST|nr:hypothetical protein ElyMa_006541800 [Elysia marginata]